MNEIPSQLLNKIDCPEYEEYNSLRGKDFEGGKYKGILFILFHIILCLIIVSIYLIKNDYSNSITIKQSVLILATSILFPPCWFITFFIVALFRLEALYERIFQHFSHKTNIYNRAKSLENYFVPIEKQIEEQALLILDSIKSEAETRLSANREINDYLWRKRNPSLYLYEIKKAKKNYELNQRSLKTIDDNIKYIKFNLERRKDFEKLQRSLKYEYVKWHYVSTDSPPPSFENSQNPLPSTEKTYSDNEKIASYQNKKLPSNDKTASNHTNPTKQYPKKVTGLSKSSVEDYQEPKQLEFDFIACGMNLRDLEEIPTKKNTVKYERIIKASPDFFQRIADKKLEIGMKGELLAMDYERQRLMSEGEIPDERLEHSSVEIGDGLGYDIRSFEDGKEIYIEVKTTTGSFWSNLFFTENEFDKMNKYDDQYYLYRICEFNVDTNSGELFIFKGKEFINSYFEFKSKMYVLTPK